MMKTYRILKTFGDHVAGSVVELDNSLAKGLLAAGSIEEVVIDKATLEFQKTIQEKMEKVASQAAAEGARKALESAKASVSGINIHIGASEEDKLIAGKGFKGFGHFCYDIYKAGKAEVSEPLARYVKAAKAAGMNEAVDSEGGYLVPTEHSTMLLEKSLEDSIVRPRAQVVPMGSSSIKIDAVKDANRTSTLFGGVRIYRTPEGGKKESSKPALSQVQLNLNKLTGLCYVTDELLQDSPQSIEALVNRLFPEAMRYKQDTEYLTSNGAGCPLGALNAANPSILAITKEAGQGADTIVVENVLKMYARCYGKNNAVWVANHDAFVQLATMVLKVGTGGVPVWLPGNNTGIAGAPQGTLLGRPLILSELVPTVGDQGDLSLCDFSQYLIGERAGEGLQTASSIHLRFDYDETAFRFTFRNDGQPWWLSTLTPVNGATMSPFVVIEARA